MAANTSELGYYVRGAADEVSSNLALDTAAVRHVVNNLRHLQDECPQIYANVCTSVGTALQYYETATSSAVDLSAFIGLPASPVFLRRRPADGTSHRYIVRVRVYMPGADTGTFVVALRTFDRSGLRTIAPPLVPFDSSSATFSHGTATPTDYQVILYANAVSSAYAHNFPTVDQYGNASTVSVAMGQIEVWALSTSGMARIEAFTVREYVGS